MDLSPTIKKVQQAVGVEPDGIAGPKTWAAISSKLGLENQAQPTNGSGGGSSTGYIFDERTESNIKTLTPETQKVAREFLRQVLDSGISVKILSGTRTYAEQNRLYEIGRSRPDDDGKWRIVTKARGGYSNHNFGIAFDIGIFDEHGHYLEESPLYEKVSKIGKNLGLSWGGDWNSIQDEPHYELRPGWANGMSESDMLAKLRSDNPQLIA